MLVLYYILIWFTVPFLGNGATHSGLCLSISMNCFSRDSPTGQPSEDIPLWRLFSGDSVLCQDDKSKHHSMQTPDVGHKNRACSGPQYPPVLFLLIMAGSLDFPLALHPVPGPLHPSFLHMSVPFWSLHTVTFFYCNTILHFLPDKSRHLSYC